MLDEILISEELISSIGLFVNIDKGESTRAPIGWETAGGYFGCYDHREDTSVTMATVEML